MAKNPNNVNYYFLFLVFLEKVTKEFYLKNPSD
jgi:hypothetical protein